MGGEESERLHCREGGEDGRGALAFWLALFPTLLSVNGFLASAFVTLLEGKGEKKYY